MIELVISCNDSGLFCALRFCSNQIERGGTTAFGLSEICRTVITGWIFFGLQKTVASCLLRRSLLLGAIPRPSPRETVIAPFLIFLCCPILREHTDETRKHFTSIIEYFREFERYQNERKAANKQNHELIIDSTIGDDTYSGRI